MILSFVVIVKTLYKLGNKTKLEKGEAVSYVSSEIIKQNISYIRIFIISKITFSFFIYHYSLKMVIDYDKIRTKLYLHINRVRQRKRFWFYIYIIIIHSHGCQAGSIRHKLSWLLAAATNWLTLLSLPSKVAKPGIDNILEK